MGRRFRSAASAGSRILAADIAELRTFIDQDYSQAFPPPHPPFPWSWTNVVAGDRILAKHFKQMRDAIQELWTFKGRGALPMWSSGVNPGGESLGTAPTRIRASDLTDLRRWLNQYEDNHPPGDQGIDSFGYDPRSSAKSLITAAWAQDVKDLALDKPLFVRANVKADGVDGPVDLPKYRQALNYYRDKGLRVFALFTREFYEPAGVDPDAALDPTDLANPYIRVFSDRARDVATDLNANAGVQDYIIWNEPNVTSTHLDEDRFGALVYHCRSKIPVGLRLYWGGIQFGPGSGDQPDQNALSYITNVYNWLFNNQLVGPWPWDGVNIHIHNDSRSDNQLNAIHDSMDAIMVSRGDPGALIVGEWGVTQEEQRNDPGWNPVHPANPMAGVLNNVKLWASVMFFFQHGNNVEGSSTWGVHQFSEAPGNPGQYVLGVETNLHGPLDALVGA